MPFLDLLDPSGFSYSAQQGERNLNRTLRFDESLDIPVPNWPPHKLPNGFWAQYNYYLNTFSPPENEIFAERYAQARLKVNPKENLFSIGFNAENWGGQAFDREYLYREYDPVDGSLGPLSKMTLYKAPKSYAIPAITIKGHISIDLPLNAILDSSNIINFTDLWMPIDSNENFTYFLSQKYRSLGIAQYPPILNPPTGAPLLGIEYDEETMESIGGLKALPFPPPPIPIPVPIGDINCYSFSISNYIPMTLTLSTDTADIGFYLGPGGQPVGSKGAFVTGYPTILDSQIAALSMGLGLSRIHGSDLTVGHLQSHAPFIAQSTITSSYLSIGDGYELYNNKKVVIDCPITSDICTIFDDAHVEDCSIELEHLLIISSGTTKGCTINVASPPPNEYSEFYSIRDLGLWSEYEIDNTTEPPTTGYINQYLNNRELDYLFNLTEQQVGWIRKYNIVSSCDFENCEIGANSALIGGTLSNCSLSIAKVDADGILRLYGGKHDIGMFLQAPFTEDEPEVDYANGRLVIGYNTTVDLLSDILLRSQPLDSLYPEYSSCITGCIHTLDIKNYGHLNVNSTHTLSLSSNNGVINVANSLQLSHNYGTVNGNHVSCYNNSGTIDTADGSIGRNYASLIGNEYTVGYQYYEGGDETHNITAYLNILAENHGGDTLSFDATFLEKSKNKGYIKNAIFANDSENDGFVTGNASFIDNSTNKSSLTNISVSLSNWAVSIDDAVIAECTLSISQQAVCAGEVNACKVDMQGGFINNSATRGCDISLAAGGISSDEFISNKVVANGGAIYSDNGGGNTIVLNNASLGGFFYNYNLPPNPKGDCPGPPNPYSNPNECTSEKGCVGCWYHGCWNKDQPPSNGGSIVFDNGTNVGLINHPSPENFDYPVGCIGQSSSSPNPGYTTVYAVNRLVPVRFENESTNYGFVNRGIFNSRSTNLGQAINSIFNAGTVDTNGFGNTYNAGSSYYGSSIGGAIVNGGTIFLFSQDGSGGGGGIDELNSGTVYADAVSGLTITKANGGTIVINNNSHAGSAILSVGTGATANIICSGAGHYKIFIGSVSQVTISSQAGALVELVVQGRVNTLNLDGNVMLSMSEGGFASSINNNRILWNKGAWGIINNNGVLWTKGAMGTTGGTGVKICLHQFAPPDYTLKPPMYYIDDLDCATGPSTRSGFPSCASLTTALLALFPIYDDPRKPPRINPRYIGYPPDEFLSSIPGRKDILCV